MGIKVHGALTSTATVRALACLHEKGLDYELVPVDLLGGEHKKEPFLSLNPFGQVPGFEDGDLKLFESRAITRYIAHAYSEDGTPLISKDVKKMAIVSVWEEVEAQQYDPPASKLVMELCIKPNLFKMPPDDAIVKEQEAKLGTVLDVYDARLAQSKYMGGDDFTLADLHHLPTMEYLMGTRVKSVFESRPHVKAWSEDIMARPSWQKVIDMRNKK